MMDEKRLAEIEARCDATADGRWANRPHDDANWGFSAHARADVRDLVAEVRRLRKARAELNEMAQVGLKALVPEAKPDVEESIDRVAGIMEALREARIAVKPVIKAETRKAPGK